MKIGAVMFFTTDSMQPAALGRALEEGAATPGEVDRMPAAPLAETLPLIVMLAVR